MRHKWCGCPNCKTFRRISNSTVSYICFKCREYVRVEDALTEDDMDDKSQIMDNRNPIDKYRAKAVGDMREKAREWKKDVVAGKYPYYDPNIGKQVQ